MYISFLVIIGQLAYFMSNWIINLFKRLLILILSLLNKLILYYSILSNNQLLAIYSVILLITISLIVEFLH